MRILNICEGSRAANCYLLVCDGHALVIDPTPSVKAISGALEKENATLDGILLTHGHFDHIVSIDTVRDKFGVPAYIHKEDAIMLTDGKKNGFFELFGKERVYKAADRLLEDADVITVGNKRITVFHTPGHTHGSVCYLADGVAFTGDTLFADTYGRCDLWNGDETRMRDSLKRLRMLDPSITIYPGHGMSYKLGMALDNTAFLL